MKFIGVRSIIQIIQGLLLIGAAQYLDDELYAQYISFLVLVGYSQLANFGIPNYLVAKLAQVPDDRLFVKGLLPITFNQIILALLIGDTVLISIAFVIMNISLYFKSLGRVYDEYNSQNYADIGSIILLAIAIFLFRDLVAIEIAVIIGALIFPLIFISRNYKIFQNLPNNLTGMYKLYINGINSLGAMLFTLVFPLILRDYIGLSFEAELKHFTILEKAFIILNSLMFVATVKLFSLKNEGENELFESITLIRILSAVVIFTVGVSIFLDSVLGFSISMESTMLYATILSWAFVSGIYHAIFFARGNKRLVFLQIISAIFLFITKDTSAAVILIILILFLHILYYITFEFRKYNRALLGLVVFLMSTILMIEFPILVIVPLIILIFSWRKLYVLFLDYSRINEK